MGTFFFARTSASCANITCGVPQGSIHHLYTDDFSKMVADKDISVVENSFETGLQIVSE